MRKLKPQRTLQEKKTRLRRTCTSIVTFMLCTVVMSINASAAPSTTSFTAAMKTALQAIFTIAGVVVLFMGIAAIVEANHENDPVQKSKGGKTVGVGVGIIVLGNVGVPALITMIDNVLATT